MTNDSLSQLTLIAPTYLSSKDKILLVYYPITTIFILRTLTGTLKIG
ncbi:hypothetical protein LC605_22220 [Nostoc sp. CHAB 5836]|nr:hypothetical protein [Nostoc sp. CHAB 5836]